MEEHVLELKDDNKLEVSLENDQNNVEATNHSVEKNVHLTEKEQIEHSIFCLTKQKSSLKDQVQGPEYVYYNEDDVEQHMAK